MQASASEILKNVVSVLTLGLLAFLLYLAVRPKKPAKPPADTTVPTTPDEQLPAAPSFLGWNLGKDLFAFGERILLNVGPEFHGNESDCNAQSHGLVDNLSGPYLCRLRAWGKDTLLSIPIYGYDGGARCDGSWMPVRNGVFYEMYAFGQRPYNNTGSLDSCNVFVPYDEAAATPKACPTSPALPPSATAPNIPVGEIVLEVQFQNRFGVPGAPYRSIIRAQSASC